MLMVMKIIQDFCEANKLRTLTEYEVLMYEQACNMAATYCKQQDIIGRAQQLGIDRAFHNALKQHEKWQNEIENCPDRKPVSGDEGVGPEGGGAGVPA